MVIEHRVANRHHQLVNDRSVEPTGSETLHAEIRMTVRYSHLSSCVRRDAVALLDSSTSSTALGPQLGNDLTAVAQVANIKS
jgi:hypothetical protein